MVHKPAPYQAPRIEVSSEGAQEKKAWQTIRGKDIRPGDIVQGCGLVVSVGEHLRDPAAYWIEFQNHTKSHYAHAMSPYEVFTEVRSGDIE